MLYYFYILAWATLLHIYSHHQFILLLWFDILYYYIFWCILLQSTLDAPLALGALISCCIVCSLITSPKWVASWLQCSSQTTNKHGRAEFLSRSPVVGSRGKLWSTPKSTKSPPLWSNSPVRGIYHLFFVVLPLYAHVNCHVVHYWMQMKLKFSC